MNDLYSALVVDDSPTMRQLVAVALSRIDQIRVTEAIDGVDAIKKLQVTPFDLFLIDVNMPNMDGFKLLSHVRADPTHHKTPIVVITTQDEQQDRDRAMALGANIYITKPIQASELMVVVRGLLRI